MEPAIRIYFLVETRTEFIAGCPFPWTPGPLAWKDLESAIEEAEGARASHVKSGAGHLLDIRVVKVKAETMRVFRDPSRKTHEQEVRQAGL